MHNLFATTVETLLGGEFICDHAFPELYAFLAVQSNKDDVDTYIKRLGRRIALTGSGDVYFASSSNIDDRDVAVAAKSALRDVIQSFEPLVYFLREIKNLQRSYRVLQAGDVLKESELHAYLEDSPSGVESISKLTTAGVFRTQHKAPRAQIGFILEKLVDMRFLNKIKDGHYKATGRWSALDDALLFVYQNESLGVDAEDTHNQGFLDL
jgi:hypothetical protein